MLETMAVTNLQLFFMHFITALVILLPLSIGYRLFGKEGSDPVQRSYKYIIIGILPFAGFHLLHALGDIGIEIIKLTELTNELLEHAITIFAFLMIYLGLNITKTEIYDKFEMFGNKRSKAK